MANWQELKNNSRLKDVFDLRIEVLRLIREFFWQENFKEIETPVALKYPGQEPYLNPIPVDFHNPNNEEVQFWLRTSPEFALKKLLGVGYDKIFELGKCFRDFEEWGGHHNTEFTMLEFYRMPGTEHDIMDNIEGMFKFIAKNLKNNKLSTVTKDWERVSMKELWSRELGVNLDELLETSGLVKLARELDLAVNDEDVYEDVFYKIFLNKIETKLGFKKPIFIFDYPAQMCSLSELCEDDPRYAKRFELYINGLEIGNGFGELLDPIKQEENFKQDKKLRESLGKEIFKTDEELLSALGELKSKNTKAGGVALGVDRMVLLFSQANNLNEVIFGSVADQNSY